MYIEQFYKPYKSNPMNQKAFLVGTHMYSFRAGEPAEIIGVQFVIPTNQKPRPCYHVRFKDGKEDFTPISDSRTFKILSEEDVRLGRVPEVM